MQVVTVLLCPLFRRVEAVLIRRPLEQVVTVHRTCRDIFVGKSAGLVIERLRVRIQAGAKGDFPSPELTLCVDPYSVSVPPSPPPPPVFLQWQIKDPGHSDKNAGGRLYLNTHRPLNLRSRSGLICRCPGIVWEPLGKRAHT